MELQEGSCGLAGASAISRGVGRSATPSSMLTIKIAPKQPGELPRPDAWAWDMILRNAVRLASRPALPAQSGFSFSIRCRNLGLPSRHQRHR